jgi:hypothetical protein
MYIPFTAVAEAFGVPEQNMEWDGEKLRMCYSKSLWKDYKPDSDIAVWSEGGKKKLEAPMRVKNGVMMINGANLNWSLFPTDPASTPPLIKAESSRGGSSATGVLSGKPVICCSVVTSEGGQYGKQMVFYWDYKTQAVFKSYDKDVIARQRELEKQLIQLIRD